MITLKEKIRLWYSSNKNMLGLREDLSKDTIKAALELTQEKNNPQRFGLAIKNSNDKIIEQSSMFDQMKGWNDCLNFLLSLSLPPAEIKTPDPDIQYEDNYVKEAFSKNYPNQ